MTRSFPNTTGAVTFTVSILNAQADARRAVLMAAGGDTIILPNSAIRADAQQYLAQSGERKKIHFVIGPEIGAISQP